MKLSFVKACALGNDFVILNGNEIEGLSLDKFSNKIADRRYGVGCDQVIYVYETEHAEVFKIRFFNSDGSEAESCGNGSRCVSKMLMNKYNLSKVILETLAGRIECQHNDEDQIKVIYPQLICTINSQLPFNHGRAFKTVRVNIGNPHLVFFIKESFDNRIHLSEDHFDSIIFQQFNVGFAQILSSQEIALTVIERGSGLTPACGTGACASAFGAYALGFVDREVQVIQKGGNLKVQLQNDHIALFGEALLIYKGEFPIDQNRVKFSSLS